MPALDDYNTEAPPTYALSPGQSFKLKHFFWAWYYVHSNDVIVSIAIFFKVRVKHLKPLFVLLFGDSNVLDL